MEPRVVKPPGQDLVVERLKSRYGLGGGLRAEVRPAGRLPGPRGLCPRVPRGRPALVQGAGGGAQQLTPLELLAMKQFQTLKSCKNNAKNSLYPSLEPPAAIFHCGFTIFRPSLTSFPYTFFPEPFESNLQASGLYPQV